MNKQLLKEEFTKTFTYLYAIVNLYALKTFARALYIEA